MEKANTSDMKLRKLREENEHLKLYKDSWHLARKMCIDAAQDKNRTKEERKAIMDMFNDMTIAINEVVKNIKM